MMNQRQAVFSAVCAVLERNPHPGEVVRSTLSKEQLEQVEQHVVELFLENKVQLKDSDTKPRTKEYIMKYVPGLVNNWLRKDKALNGGNTYVAKNPGIRTGSGDESLKAMKTLLAITKDAEARKQVEAEIARRTAELSVAKQKPINVAALPEHLRHLVPQQEPVQDTSEEAA